MLNIVLYYSPVDDMAFVEEPDEGPGTPYSEMKADYLRQGGQWEIDAECRYISDKDAKTAHKGGSDYDQEEFIACLRFDDGGSSIIKQLLGLAYSDSEETVDEAIRNIAIAFYKLGIKHGKENHAGKRTLHLSE